MAKRKSLERFDGLNPDDERKLRIAIRQVWSWSYSRRLCIQRATGKDGFARCEECKRKVPKVQPDHIEPIGRFDPKTFIQKCFVPSDQLKALCRSCHGKKTRLENFLRDIGAA